MITALRGFRDIWGEDWEVFEEIISTFKNRLRDFNVVWIETPILEPLELFVRKKDQQR
jgi:histidyl-tRNA synthetase